MVVTILVPVYGVEKYIRECAESLFNQTYQDIEYIFCDDCSPDNSIGMLKETIERFPARKPHVRIIKNDKNKRIGGTRAHLISEIRSDYFVFVDSDDCLPLEAIEKLAKRMQATNVDIVEGAHQVSTNGKITSTTLPNHDNLGKYRKKVQVGNLVRHQLWGRLYKTEVINRVPDLFVQGIDMAEDYCAITRLAAVTTRAWTDDVVYFYRMDGDSFYSKEKEEKSIRSRLYAMKTVLSFYQQRGPLPLTMEIGIIDAYRMCYRMHEANVEMIDNALLFKPQHCVAKWLLNVLRSNCSSKLKDFIYKAVRFVAVYCTKD